MIESGRRALARRFAALLCCSTLMWSAGPTALGARDVTPQGVGVAPDEWENDDSPLSASTVNFQDAPIDNRNPVWIQDHQFHDRGDEDWFAVVGDLELPSARAAKLLPIAVSQYTLTITGTPLPQTGQTISIELYDKSIFRDPQMAVPLAVFNACDQAPQMNYQLVDHAFALRSSEILIGRVLECDGRVAESPGYRIIVELTGQASSAGGALVNGRVLLQDTQLPPATPSLVRSDNNDMTFSIPNTGDFAILATADESGTLLRAETETHLSQSVATGALVSDTESQLGQPLFLVPKSLVFRDGFEQAAGVKSQSPRIAIER